MNVIILSPEITDIKISKPLLEQGGVVVFTNPVQQNHCINKTRYPNFIFKDIKDYMEAEAFASVDNESLYFTYNWYLQKEIADVISFKNVNIGGLFVSYMKYCFIGILKAFLIVDKLLGAHKSDVIYVIHDRDRFSRIFRFLAIKKNIQVRVLRRKRHRRQKIEIVSYMKRLCKALFIKLSHKRGLVKDPNEKVIFYSLSLKFAEPLWNELKHKNRILYLRPILSYKALKITKVRPDLKLEHITPEYTLNNNDLKMAKGSVDINNILMLLDRYFAKSSFFNYKGYNLWDVVREDLTGIIRSKFMQYIKWILSFYNIFDALKVACVIVDEDHSDFNQALVMCARQKGIKCYQILHGLIGHAYTITIVNSTKILVFGESSKRRLIDHGTAPEKIGVIGAPFYESMIKNIDRNRTKLNFFSHFKLREATRVVTLATQPFRTEEHPDYINTYVTPKNIEDKLRITLKAIKDIDNIKLVIKLHPADTNIWFTQDIVKEEDCAGKVIILKDYSLFDILASTDLLLVGGSTVYLEALLLKIPIYIFDRSERRFLKFMSEDYLDLSNKEQAIKNLRNILKSDVLLKERLKKQEEELSWHFYNNNIGAIDNLKRLVSTD